MTKIGELRELGVADLEQRENELAEQLFRLRLQKSMGVSHWVISSCSSDVDAPSLV